MSGFDADRVYSVSVHQNASSFSTESSSETEKLLLDFLLQYRLGGEFTYRYASLLRPRLALIRSTQR
jgi:DNA replication licensing factor MCM5